MIPTDEQIGWSKRELLVGIVILLVICLALLSGRNSYREKYEIACLLWQHHSAEVYNNAVELEVDDEFRSFNPLETSDCENRVREWMDLEK